MTAERSSDLACACASLRVRSVEVCSKPKKQTCVSALATCVAVGAGRPGRPRVSVSRLLQVVDLDGRAHSRSEDATSRRARYSGQKFRTVRNNNILNN